MEKSDDVTIQNIEQSREEERRAVKDYTKRGNKSDPKTKKVFDHITTEEEEHEEEFNERLKELKDSNNLQDKVNKAIALVKAICDNCNRNQPEYGIKCPKSKTNPAECKDMIPKKKNIWDKVGKNNVAKSIDSFISKTDRKWPRHSMRRTFKPEHGKDPILENIERRDYEKRLPKTQQRQFSEEEESPITSKRPANVPLSQNERQRQAIERVKKLNLMKKSLKKDDVSNNGTIKSSGLKKGDGETMPSSPGNSYATDAGQTQSIQKAISDLEKNMYLGKPKETNPSPNKNPWKGHPDSFFDPKRKYWRNLDLETEARMEGQQKIDKR